MTTTARHIRTDALAGLRDELMRAATRRHSSRRRTRRAGVAAAIVVGLLAATAGAAELTGFTTGVPAVDELLNVDVGPSHRPGLGDASDPLVVPEGNHRTNVVAYRARDGSICVATADFHRNSVRGSFGGCPSLQVVNRRIERQAAIWFGSAIGGDRRVNRFLVAGGVRTVQALGEGDWNVLMTAPWTPHGRDGRPLRLVAVIDDADIGNPDDGVQMGELTPDAYNQPTLKLTYRDGHTRVFRGTQAK
jgi:hypothetical protein